MILVGYCFLLPLANAFRLDSAGANPERVLGQLRNKLRMNAAMVVLPMGAEADFAGSVFLVLGASLSARRDADSWSDFSIVDLVKMRAMFNEGEKG